jgi:hypothetical protein
MVATVPNKIGWGTSLGRGNAPVAPFFAEGKEWVSGEAKPLF